MAKKQKKTITDDEVTPPLGTLLEQPAELSTDAGAFDDLPAPLEEEVAAHDAANEAQVAVLEQEHHEAMAAVATPESDATPIVQAALAKVPLAQREQTEAEQIATHGHVLAK